MLRLDNTAAKTRNGWRALTYGLGNVLVYILSRAYCIHSKLDNHRSSLNSHNGCTQFKIANSKPTSHDVQPLHCLTRLSSIKPASQLENNPGLLCKTREYNER